MRITVGIDEADLYRSALGLVGRLGFLDPQLTLLHAVEPLHLATSMANPFPSVELDEMEAARRGRAEAVLEGARQFAQHLGFLAQAEIETGLPSGILSDLDTDLVAIGAKPQDALPAAFLGSVARALAIGSRSNFLVSRGEVEPEGPVHAVFATDQSQYAENALTWLVGAKPAGLKKVTLATAVPELTAASLQSRFGYVPSDFCDPDQMRAEAQTAGESWAERLRANGVDAEVRIEDGTPSQALPRVVSATGADLLIMGAQGHGFLERLLIGSVALQQTLEAPYPVMVIRA